MKLQNELSPEELEQVSGGVLLLQKSAVRSLTVQVSPAVTNGIGNVAICSSCHGCTHSPLVPVLDQPVVNF